MTNTYRYLLLCITIACILTGCSGQNIDVEKSSKSHSESFNSINRNLRDVIGSSHVRGCYYFGKEDFLNEGADRLLEMGAGVIKVWFYNGEETPDVMYPYNSKWPKANSLVEGAKLPYWKKLFNKPFTTYILQVMAMNKQDYYWLTGMTADDMRDEEQQFYELTKHFLITYKNTGKTFIFAHHEGDWHLRDKHDFETEAPQIRLKNMVKWLQARQNGVNRARADVGMHGVKVYNAAEVVNVIKSIKEGQANMVNSVIPYVKLDLIAYSAWDSTVIGGIHPAEEITTALDYIAKNAQDSKYFGNKNVFISEYGLPENDDGDKQAVVKVVRNVTEKGLAWGCPYIVYWQLYCNEAKADIKVPVKSNDEVRGFWLIKPDGTKSVVWDYFYNLLKSDSSSGI
ncbi:MAG: hypothetical protein WC770_02110 [Phycisphaerae bacterium]|jgi:hypothetical protein